MARIGRFRSQNLWIAVNWTIFMPLNESKAETSSHHVTLKYFSHNGRFWSGEAEGA